MLFRARWYGLVSILTSIRAENIVIAVEKLDAVFENDDRIHAINMRGTTICPTSP